MYGGEEVCRPDSENNKKDKGGEIDGATTAQTGMPTDVDHADVGDPEGKGEQNLGIGKVGEADCLLGEGGADEEPGRHAGQAEEETFQAKLIGGFERRQAAQGGLLVLEAALLNEIKHGGEKRNKKGRVGGEQQNDVEKDPAGVRQRDGLGAGAEGGGEGEQNGERQEKDAGGNGAKTQKGEQKGPDEEGSEHALAFVPVDREGVVGGDERLRDGDDVKQQTGGGEGDGEVSPAGAIVKGRRHHGERRNGVEQDGDTKPDEGHRQAGADTQSNAGELSLCAGELA